MVDVLDYRRRLYAKYSAAHPRGETPITLDLFRYEARVYRKTFGPLLLPDKHAAIFEIGCGAGSFLHFLQEEGYDRVAGMDQDAEHVATARRLGVDGASAGDAFGHLAARAGTYDCIVAIDVLEHFTKAEIFGKLDVIRDALRPGGTLIWRAPNADGPFAGRIRYGDLTHELAYTKGSAWQLMRTSGFTDVRILPEEPVVTGARSAARVLLWTLFRAAAKAYLFAESYAQDSLLTPNLIVSARKESAGGSAVASGSRVEG